MLFGCKISSNILRHGTLAIIDPRIHLLYNVFIMNKAVLSIRTDDQTKKEIAGFAASVGLSISAFATVVLKQAVREGRVVLSPSLEPTPYLEQIMREARADYKAGRNVTKTKTKAEALAHLRKL
jgi:antitoxin component of RelBE/YafQ-DinJ toxin-antitoxin module